jgi:predicted nucleic acid-binding protein
MNPNSTNSFLFTNSNLKFLAPSFILDEFKKHENECLIKSRLSKEKFSQRKKEIFSKIKFIEYNEYKQFIREAIKITPDVDDTPYFALALKTSYPIWTNDAQLKNQSDVLPALKV